MEGISTGKRADVSSPAAPAVCARAGPERDFGLVLAHRGVNVPACDGVGGGGGSAVRVAA